jgi:transcriptional regulator with XRE-family HTH domain
LKISQEQLAEKAETNPNYVSRMERGTENPTLDYAHKDISGFGSRNVGTFR